MEARRRVEQNFQSWEPFVWEMTSVLSFLFLIPVVLFLLKKVPLTWHNIKYTFFVYIAVSMVFSLLHFLMMWGMRTTIYAIKDWHYNIGEIPFELLYEYRKDIWTFFAMILVTKAYQFILSRLQGEANPIFVGEDIPVSTRFDRLLVKKLGKEFIIKVEDVEWLESSGNYVNLHIKGRIYPTRATLPNLIERISDKGFCRIHRSHAINLDVIDSITPLSSGDSEVRLLNGKVLNLSRRYKEAFKLRLH